MGAFEDPTHPTSTGPAWSQVTDELAGGESVLPFSGGPAAFAHAFSLGSGPLVLPACAPAGLFHAADASNRELRLYELGGDLEPVADTLRRALGPGCLVVLPAPFGRPPSAAALDLARSVGCGVLEDRTAAPLSELALAGQYAVSALHPWLDVPDGALLVSRRPLAAPVFQAPDVALIVRRLEETVAALEAGRPAIPSADGESTVARRLSAWTRVELERPGLVAALRARAEAFTRAHLAELASALPFARWPDGCVAHGFPVLADGGAALARLADAGVTAVRPWIARTHAGASLANRLLLILAGDPARAAAALGPTVAGPNAGRVAA